MTKDALDALFNPKSVAIIGASTDATRISGRPVRYLKESGFAGKIFPVNSKNKTVQGLPAFATVDDIEESLDAAIIALPPAQALQAARDCANRGVRQVVMFSAGFAEAGPEGVARQNELALVAKTAGMRILGPNCLGAFSVHSGAFLTFSGVFDDVRGTKGRFGLVSQSGGYAGEVLKSALARGVAFGTWVTTGNEADISFGEVLTSMAADPNVDTILGYIEGVRDAENLIAGLEAAKQARKPVIILKVGRTAAGAAAAASHTASLAGEDAIYDVIFKEFGVYRARTTAEMLDVAYATKRGVFPINRDIAIVTNSGGLGIQSADYAADYGMTVADIPDDAQAKISAVLPFASPQNPVDTTGQVANDPKSFGTVVDAILDTGKFGSSYVNIGLIGGLPFLIDPLIDVFSGVSRAHSEKIIAVTVTAPTEVVVRYEAAGMLAFPDPASAICGLAALTSFAEFWRKDAGKAAPKFADFPTVKLSANTSFSEVEGKAVLAKIGIPAPAEHVFADAAHVAELPDAEYAVKVISPDILHKSDVGGVALNISARDVPKTIENIAARVGSAAPEAKIDGYLVGQMLTDGVDCIVGVHRDPVFGPVIMFGLGGVTVELYGDVTTRRAPVSIADAHEMIREIRGWPLLNGYRGAPKADIDAMAKAISAVSKLAAENADVIKTIEVNPLRALAVGHGVVALDAVIETIGPSDA